MKTKTIVLITLAIFGVLLGAAFLLGGTSTFIANEQSFQEPVDDPIDVASEFANDWLDNLAATSTVALADFLATKTTITEPAKAKLQSADSTDIDVILCQPTVPGRIGAKPVYVTDGEAQVMVIARGDDKGPNQAIVTLTLVEQNWIISDITCSAGETGGPVGEFSFEQTGRLVRESVPAPYDSSRWHLIFNQPDGTVQVVLLQFDGGSQCVGETGAQVCDPSQLSEGAAAYVQADMDEAGALVRRLDTQ